MGGIPKGLIEGTFSSFGDYDQCVNIRSANSNNIDSTFTGKYCLLSPILPFPEPNSYKTGEPVHELYSVFANNLEYPQLRPLATVGKMIGLLNVINGSTIKIGICIPSTCDASDIESAVNQGKHY